MKTKMYSLFSDHDLRHQMGQLLPQCLAKSWESRLTLYCDQRPSVILWWQLIPPLACWLLCTNFSSILGVGWLVHRFKRYFSLCLHKRLKAAINISPHNSLASVNCFIIILPRKNERCLLLTACCVSVSHERYWQALGGLRGLLNDGLPLTCAGVWGITLLTLSSFRNDRNLLDPFNRQKGFLSDGLPSISTGGVLLLQHQRGWIERLFSMRDICCCVF